MERDVDAPARAPEDFGFVRHEAGARRLWVARDWEQAVLPLGLLEAGGCARLLAEARGPRGRSATAVVPVPGRAEQLHLRAVRHGGWLAPLWGDRLLGAARPVAELRVTCALREAGAPVPEPVLALAERRAGPFVRAAVATVHEPDTVDGIALLEAEPSAADAHLALVAAAQAVRAFHDAGGRHLDLHLGNLLFRASAECLVIDLDKARRVRQVRASARMSELMRLYRSLARRDLLRRLGPDPCDRFLAAYTAGDSSLRSALLHHLPRERARLALHRLAWPASAKRAHASAKRAQRGKAERSHDSYRNRDSIHSSSAGASSTSSATASTRTSAVPAQAAGILRASFSVVTHSGACSARCARSEGR